MDKCIPIYRDTEKTKEAWANLDGSNEVVERSHKDGPPNRMFRGVRRIMSVPSEEYRRNFEDIRWERKLP